MGINNLFDISEKDDWRNLMENRCKAIINRPTKIFLFLMNI